MNKMLILCTTAFVISACAVVVKYIQTGVFDVYKFAAVVCFAMLAFGSWSKKEMRGKAVRYDK